MDRRSFLALPMPSFDNCQYCGFGGRTGEHGIMGPSEIEGKIKVSCRVPIELTQPPPVVDVLYGTGTFKTHRMERLIDGT